MKRSTITSNDRFSNIRTLRASISGSGAWRVIDVVPAEEDVGVPVVHPVAARVWYVQRQLRVRQPVQGAGRLLVELP